ncbi:MAG TPA: crossover junction endodeoxyribonuclease RuvC [Candidatus Magasanikbacteria bacterium]|nr:crossover junction endodeoxyribonuclease RuvC [Candidatus Magasanikbacteria bacterium]
MRILGIDPGYGRMGYGVIEKKQSGQWKALVYGCLNTDSKKSFVCRLMEIKEKVDALSKKYKPEVMGVEKLFFFKNAKTAMDVGQARGAILLAGIENKMEIYEFTPLQVKQAITGYGKAEKKQIQKMTATVLGLKQKIKSDDAADALAVAVCAAQRLWMEKIKSR